MKKILLTVMLAATLVIPLGGIAQAETVEPSQPITPAVEDMEFTPGNVPAETEPLDSITPAIHGVILAMLNHGADSISASNDTLGWEATYNMLSLYGQMDDRAEYTDEELILPSEIVMDFSASLSADLGELPADLADRMVYEADSDCYRLVCGETGLSQIQLETVRDLGSKLEVTGSLVYLVDNTDLVQFRAVLAEKDNLFGYALTKLDIV